MLSELIVSLVTLACIIVFVVWLMMQPQRRILQIAVPSCVAGFAIIYAFYLVARLVPDNPIFGIPAALSAFVEAFGSLTNGVAYSDVADSERVKEVFGLFWFETLFWALHMLVIISLAISGFAVFGRKFMDKIRFRLHLRFARQRTYFIFGDSEGALLFGKNLSEEEPRAFIVYFSEEYNEGLRERIADFGGALIEVNGETRQEMQRVAEKAMPQNVVEFKGAAKPTVNGCSIADLLARKVVKEHAPYGYLLDNSDADAKNSPLERIPTLPYAAVVVGFGELGCACLKQLIMASQLTLSGARPKFYVINRSKVSFEKFCIENPCIGMCADIEFIEADIFTFEAQKTLDEAVQNQQAPLRQVYVCCAPVQAASPAEQSVLYEKNERILTYLKGLLVRSGRYSQGQLDSMFVSPYADEEQMWTPEIVLHRELDRRAIRLNGYYASGGQDYSEWSEEERKAFELEKWYGDKAKSEKGTCDLDKDSSRASADFMEAFYALLGIDPGNPDAAIRYKTALEQAGVLEALARIEHNRWCAFHYCNGFTVMDKEEFMARAEKGRAAFSGDDKPHRDTLRKIHPCLVPWEDLSSLDPLYALYDADIKNGATSLQKRDTDNPILASQYVGI